MEGNTAIDRARALTRPDELAALDDAEPRLIEAAETRERLARELMNEAGGFRQIVAGLRALRGEEVPPLPSTGSIVHKTTTDSATAVDAGAVVESPRGIAAVRRVMQAGGVFTPASIHAELQKRGWVNPDAKHPEKATETALHRLYQRGDVERVARGRYRYRRSSEPPDLLIPDYRSEEP